MPPNARSIQVDDDVFVCLKQPPLPEIERIGRCKKRYNRHRQCPSVASSRDASPESIDHASVWNSLEEPSRSYCFTNDTLLRRCATSVSRPDASISTSHKFPTKSRLKHSRSLISVTTSLPILVFMDMFAVSLVIPLLFQYYKAAGVKKANQREMMSSLFSTAQIVGGLIMGVLTDAGYVPGRMLLFLSFAGSAISYALIGHNNASLVALMISRILVGLVKQTMTVSITMVTNATSADTRAEHLGKLTAASTIAWIIGPTIGSWLFRYVDERAPAWVATGLFLINLLIAFFFLGEEEEEKNVKNWNRYREEKSKQQTSKDELKRQDKSIVHNLKACFGSRALGSVVVVRLIITWVTQSMNYNQLSNFWESMHDGLESHHRGYISSYQQALQFVVQSVMVDWIFQRSGDFRRTTVLFSFLVSLAVLLESQRSLLLFLIVLCPIKSIAFTMMNLSLQTLLTDVAPKEAIFSVLAALDVLQNMASVSVPFYRSLLFRILASDEANDAMQGDPDPQAWIWSSAVHWFIASILASILLLSNSATTGTNITRAYTAKTA